MISMGIGLGLMCITFVLPVIVGGMLDHSPPENEKEWGVDL